MALDGELPARSARPTSLAVGQSRHEGAQRPLHRRSRRLQGVFAPVLKEPVPERLAALVAAGGPRRRPSPMRRFAAALPWRGALVASLVIASAGIGYLGGLSQAAREESGAEAIVERAIEAHAMYAAEKVHSVEVGADQKDHLVGWLSKRVGTPLVAPDLSAGRLSTGRRAAVARIRPGGGAIHVPGRRRRHGFALCHSRCAKEPGGFRLYEEDGQRASYWLDEGFCYAVAGTVPQAALRSIADAAHQQLQEDRQLRRPADRHCSTDRTELRSVHNSAPFRARKRLRWRLVRPRRTAGGRRSSPCQSRFLFECQPTSAWQACPTSTAWLPLRMRRLSVIGLAAARSGHLVAAPTAEVWIAVGVEAEPAGYAIVLYRRGARAARLYSLAVAAAEQGSGHGRRLLRQPSRRLSGAAPVASARGAAGQPPRPRALRGLRLSPRSLVPNYYADGAAAERYEKALVGPGRTPDAGRSARKEASLQ